MILVEDAMVKESAMAVHLGSGNFHDPDHIPGLFHLLEHCFFAGSKHFPEHNQINNWIDNHHGHLNAWTTTESSCYFFDIACEHFETAVAMLCDMLINPLLTLEGIEKEIQAIDAEFMAKVTDEQRRLIQVQRETCNPSHPFSRFSAGNKSVFHQISLPEIQSQLQQLHKAHVSTENLVISIVVPSMNESLKKSIEGLLEQFPQSKKPVLIEDTPLYLPQQLQQLITVKSLKPQHRLVLTFSVRNTLCHFRKKPENLISHLMGYEGDGGLIHYFKKKHWATTLIAGGGLQGLNFQDFNINIQLTDDGLENLDAILHAVFYFVSLIVDAKDLKWRFDEKAKLNDIAFEFQVKDKPLEQAQQVVHQFVHYHEQYLLYGDYVMDDFDEDFIKGFAADICRENMRMLLVSPAGLAPGKAQTTQYYDTQYCVEELITCEDLDTEEFQRDLFLPPKNQYIPNIESDIPAVTTAPPSRIKPESGHSLWLGTNTEYSEKRGECFFSFTHKYQDNNLADVAKRKLWAKLVQEQLIETFYPAQLAGIHFNVYAHQTGIGFHTSGFADKQLELTKQIINNLNTSCTEPAFFQLYKEQYLTSLQNRVVNKPLNRLFTYLQVLLIRGAYLPEDLLEETNRIVLDDLLPFQQREIANSSVEMMLYGYWEKSALHAFCESLPLPSLSQHSSVPKQGVTLLREITENAFEVNSNHSDSAMVYYLQSPRCDLQAKAKMMLIESILAGFYFNWIRNNKQLGYMVGTGFMPFNDHPGIALYTQSPNACVNTLEKETRSCLFAFAGLLADFEESQWQSCKNNVLRQLKNTNLSFSVLCQRYWSAIGEDNHEFNEEELLADKISSIKLADAIEFFTKLVQDPHSPFIMYSNGVHPPLNANHIVKLDSIYRYK